MENQQILENLGLTRNESAVYLALLRSGSSTAERISKESSVHRSNTYSTLDRLVTKGLVSFIKKNNKKYFQAADPEQLVLLLKEKEKGLRKILPLLALNKKLSRTTKVQVFEGAKGIGLIKKEISRTTMPVFSFGADIENAYFRNHVHNKMDSQMTTVIYSNKIALLMWDKPYAVLIEDNIMADSYREAFGFMMKVAG